MGVDDHAHRDSVERSQHYVPGLARHAGEGQNLFHGLRDLTPKLFDYDLRGSLDGLGLIAEEAGGADELFKLGQGSRRHSFGCGEGLEEGGRDEVDADVGALRREDSGDGELPGAAMVQGADDVGVGLGEDVEDGGDALFGLRGFIGGLFYRHGA